MTAEHVKQNLEEIEQKIAAAASEAGRSTDDINLVAVSKKQSADRLQAALDAGHRAFGENRVQEAISHWQDIKPQYDDLRLHLIGPLQTNKIKDAVKLFDCIETIDRVKLARKLADEMDKQNRDLPCFIQVNTGEEPQKSGVLPSELGNFFDICKGECGIDIRGLMCIPPVGDPPAVHFAFLQKLAAEYGLPDLSMGMSADFEKAIPLGATYIRVGTAVFGAREEAK